MINMSVKQLTNTETDMLVLFTLIRTSYIIYNR